MFHRPTPGQNIGQNSGQAANQPAKPDAEAIAAQQQTPVKSSVELYLENEKEKSMNPNQPGSSAESNETERAIDIPGNVPGLQQRQMPGQRMPGAFPGSSYSSPVASPYGAGAAPAKAQEGRRLVVGEGISLSGEIEACDVLIVEGTIEAALKGAKVLEIAETGVFYGTVQIDEATVAGRFEGDLTVNGRLTVRSTGSITGSVAYKELAVEAGAVLDGKVVPLSGSRADKKSDRPQQQKKAMPARDAGSELPFASTASVAG